MASSTMPVARILNEGKERKYLFFRERILVLRQEGILSGTSSGLKVIVLFISTSPARFKRKMLLFGVLSDSAKIPTLSLFTPKRRGRFPPLGVEAANDVSTMSFSSFNSLTIIEVVEGFNSRSLLNSACEKDSPERRYRKIMPLFTSLRY